MKVSTVFKIVKGFTKKYSPEILIGIGIVGWGTTTYLAVKETPKAMKLIEKAEKEKGDKLTKWETVKVAGPAYIPAAVTATASTACLVGSGSMNMKRKVALAAAYELTKTNFMDYKEKAVELLGEKKEKAIREKVAESQVKKSKDVPVIITDKGNTLFLDYQSGRMFRSDVHKIKTAVLKLNERMVRGVEEFVSLNELYDEIGLSHTPQGDDLGWNIGRDGVIELDFHPQMTEDEDVCMVMDFHIEPRRDFMNLH